MERKDWTLLAIAAGHKPLSPVQLQKTLFLLGRKLPDEVGADFYEFVPYNYGPFSQLVYHDTDVLATEGLVEVLQRPGISWREYVVTEAGRSKADQLAAAAPRAFPFLKTLVQWAQSLEFADLVRAVYAAYPEFRENSVFQE